MFRQAGENYDYVPSNQSMTEGNDDQCVWRMAIIEAVERNFTDPESCSRLELSQAIFNTMNARCDTAHCGGGLRWQIFTWNAGYNYKSSISNGCLFHLAARLVRYTGNATVYVDVAERVWDWMEEIGFIYYENSLITLFDGANVHTGCTDIVKLKWSYSYCISLSGCAYMYDFTNNEKWRIRANGCIYVFFRSINHAGKTMPTI